MSDKKLVHIPLGLIHENKEALRKVNRQNPEYIELVDSIRQKGVLNSISVRELKDPVLGTTFYSLIDGLHRFTAAKDAGLETIPAQVMSLTDGEVLEAQVMANIHKVETRPVEYSKQLVRILSENPTLTKASLAAKLAKSPKWIDDRLGLVKLDPDIGKLVDDQTLNLTNAYMLSKLDVEDQKNFLERACTQQPGEFTPTVNQRIKEVKDAKRKGRDPSKSEFSPVAHLKKLGELKEVLENPELLKPVIEGATDPVVITKKIFEWVFNIDAAGIAAQKKKHDEMLVQREVEKKKREEDREKKKREEAGKIASFIGKEQQ